MAAPNPNPGKRPVGRPRSSDMAKKLARAKKNAGKINIWHQIDRWNRIKNDLLLPSNTAVAQFLIDWFYANQPVIARPVPLLLPPSAPYQENLNHVEQHMPNAPPVSEPQHREEMTENGHSSDSDSETSENSDGVQRYHVTGSVITRMEDEAASVRCSSESVLEAETTEEDNVNGPVQKGTQQVRVKIEPQDPS